MTAQILFVDDEPDLEALILQKFRRQIRDGTVHFTFVHDGVQALAALKANSEIDLVVTDINMPRMDGLTLLHKLQESEERIFDRYRLGLWRHGEYTYCDEPWRV